MRAFLSVLTVAIVSTAFSLQSAQAQQTVKIGAYHFPPYATNTADGMGGMVAQMVMAMNEVQDTYHFEIVPTSATDRHDDFAAGEFDMLAFENIAWGWEDMGVVASDVYMGGQGIYVAASGVDQSFFNDVASHKIAAVYGYHYGFAGFDGDPAYMQQTYAVEMPLNPCTSLYYVMDGRVDLAVVPDSYLQKFLEANPKYRGRFTTGLEPDQVYEHTIVMREDENLPSVDEINAMIAQLHHNGTFDRMMEPFVF